MEFFDLNVYASLQDFCFKLARTPPDLFFRELV